VLLLPAGSGAGIGIDGRVGYQFSEMGCQLAPSVPALEWLDVKQKPGAGHWAGAGWAATWLWVASTAVDPSAHRKGHWSLGFHTTETT
jgi:hypothetical protein